MKVNRDRLSEIANECLNLLEFRDVFEWLEGTPKPHYPKMEERFVEILNTIDNFQTIELCMYLRGSFNRRESIPLWNKLLENSWQLAVKRNEDMSMFFGLK